MTTAGVGHMGADGASPLGYHPWFQPRRRISTLWVGYTTQNQSEMSTRVFKGTQRHRNGAVQYQVAMATNGLPEQ